MTARRVTGRVTIVIVTLVASFMPPLVQALGTATTVVAAGDIARPDAPGRAQRRTAALIRDIDPERVLMLGDGQYPNGSFRQYLASYDPTWGTFRRRTAPVPGNHEYETPRAAGYFTYFAEVLDRFAAKAAKADRGYYTFTAGPWRIVALNTNCGPIVRCAAERRWLRSVLAPDPYACELIFAHEANRRFVHIAAKAGADIFLNGHSHTFERWDGVLGTRLRRYVVGTGGMSLRAPDSEAHAVARAYGVLRLNLRRDGYGWRFIDVDLRVRDSGQAACHRPRRADDELSASSRTSNP
jgi:acid phosphatase type 7